MENDVANNSSEGREANKENIIKQISLWAEFSGDYLNICLSYSLLTGKRAGVFIHQVPSVIG